MVATARGKHSLLRSTSAGRGGMKTSHRESFCTDSKKRFAAGDLLFSLCRAQRGISGGIRTVLAVPPEIPRFARDKLQKQSKSKHMNDDRIPHHPVPTTVETFDALGLSAPIRQSIREVGFEHPTPIQSAVIPPALQGRDIIAR